MRARAAKGVWVDARHFFYRNGLAGNILKEKESERELVMGKERRGWAIGDNDRRRKQSMCVQCLYTLPERKDGLVQIVQLDFDSDSDSDRASSSSDSD